MKNADKERVYELCSLIAVEHDPQVFLTLVEELNRILSVKEDRSVRKN